MKIIVKKKQTLRGHNDSVYNLQASTAPGRVYSSAGDGMVVSWNLDEGGKGKVEARFQRSIYAFHKVPQSERMIVGHNYHGVHLVDLAGGREIASAAVTTAPIFCVTTYGDMAFVATGDGQLIVLDSNDLSVIKKISLTDKSLRAIAIHPDAAILAIGSSDNQIRVLDMESYKMLYRINAHKLSVFALTYTPDGRHLISGSRDAHLKVWDAAGYTLVRSIPAHMFAINDIAFSPDHRYFATCSMDKTIKLWDASQYKLLKVIDKARHDGHTTSVNRLLWGRHSSELISCSDDRTVAAWHLQYNV